MIIGEDWNWVMYLWVRAYGNGSTGSEIIATLFFLLMMIFGNIVLFSLFTAILLRNFEPDDDDDGEDEEEEVKDDVPQKSFSKRMFSKETWKGFAETFKDAFDGRRVKKEVQD